MEHVPAEETLEENWFRRPRIQQGSAFDHVQAGSLGEIAKIKRAPRVERLVSIIWAIDRAARFARYHNDKFAMHPTLGTKPLQDKQGMCGMLE
jgi:hypothetical protein